MERRERDLALSDPEEGAHIALPGDPDDDPLAELIVENPLAPLDAPFILHQEIRG